MGLMLIGFTSNNASGCSRSLDLTKLELEHVIFAAS
jgi:hypothetical protein